MNFISWNVRGLESPDRKYIAKRFLDTISNKDFIMLQKIKAVDFILDLNLEFIWKDSIKLCSAHSKGKGGTALLINPKWSKHIVDKGRSPCNSVVWASICINNVTFGVCSIYAPNEPQERAELWLWISSLPDIPWILGGDFNMVESQKDKSGGRPFNWKPAEVSTLR